jgi:signal transduction histidine kinase
MVDALEDRAPRALFSADRNRRVLRRLRWAALLGLLPLGAAAVVNVLVFEERLLAHLATLAIQAALCAATAALTWRPRAEPRAVPLALGMVLGIATVQFWAIALARGDVDVLLCAIVVVMMGSTLVFPWGVGPQAVVSVYVAAGYLLLPPWADLPPDRVANILIGVSLGVMLSVVGAFVLDRQRRETLVERERVAALAHQRELLLEAGRRLNATTELPQLVELIARLGRQVVAADSATLVLLDEARGVFRMAAISPGSTLGAADLLNVEFPEEHVRPFTDELARRRLLEVPSGTAFDGVQQLGLTYGVARVLFASVQRDGRVLGVLTFNQRQAEAPFGEQARRLAEGIAHQAAVALANARLVEHLTEANRVKTEFVSTMSHELRTPLNVILGFAEMGQDPRLAEAERVACLRKVEDAGRELSGLIEGTLEIGRLEAGRGEPRMEPVSLPELWEALDEACSRLPRKPGVTLEWAPDVPPLALVTDPRKVTIVVRNLVGNALKFTERGSVRVGARRDGEHLVLEVADTGIGIAPEEQQAIFEKFRQADGSDSRRFGGAGLGLYIVQRFIEQLGGSVRVESAPGRGSTFAVRLRLPAATPEPGRRAG